MAEIYQIPDSSSGNVGGIPFSIPVGGNGGLFGGGGNTIGELIGLAIVASIFGWNNGGGFFGGGGNQGYLASQLNGDAGRELIMSAITSNGDAQRTAVSTLASTIGQDFNIVNGQIMAIQNALNTIGANQGMNAMQVINAIQSGNASLASQFQQCCCQNQLALCQQTNALQSSMVAGFSGVQQGINGINQSIASKSASDQLAMCQQTTALTDVMNRNFQGIDNKIDALESNRKDREITALTAKVAQLESQGFTAGVVQQAVTPILGSLSALNAEIDSIKRCMPPTVTLPNNSMTAVPTVLANAVADNVLNRLSSTLYATPTTASTTPTT